jgi:hypothetical protein
MIFKTSDRWVEENIFSQECFGLAHHNSFIPKK